MFKIIISTFFFFVTFLRLSRSSPISPVTQPSSSSPPPRMPMDLCPDFTPGTKVRKASNCLPHQEMALQGLPYGHLPTAADASADPCHWHFQCRTYAARTTTSSTSGQKRFLVGSSFEDSWKEWPENLSNKSRTRAVCSFEETRDCHSLSEELVREGLLLLAKSENILLLQSWQCPETNMIWGAFFLS